MNHTQHLEVRQVTKGWAISHIGTKTPVTDAFKTEKLAKDVLNSWATVQPPFKAVKITVKESDIPKEVPEKPKKVTKKKK